MVLISLATIAWQAIKGAESYSLGEAALTSRCRADGSHASFAGINLVSVANKPRFQEVFQIWSDGDHILDASVARSQKQTSSLSPEKARRVTSK